jgi:hypothetical protein
LLLSVMTGWQVSFAAVCDDRMTIPSYQQFGSDVVSRQRASGRRIGTSKSGIGVK